MAQEPEPTLEFLGLPERVDPATWIEEVPSEPIPDPSGGRDTETDFILRNAG